MSNLKIKLDSLPSDVERSKYVEGKTAIVIANNTGTSTGINTKVTLTRFGAGSVYYKQPGLSTECCKLAIELKIDIHTIDVLEASVKSLKNSIEAIEKNIKEQEVKIDFMKVNNLQELDETAFKVYTTLTTLDDPNITQIEKANIIANLIKGK